MKKATYHLLDVFTNKKFGGNQLAVFPDSSDIDPDIMQSIAREFNLSETVFLYPVNSDGSYDMKIFTPVQELPTAGHPTIGTAYYLAQDISVEDGSSTLCLNQKVGKIEVDLDFQNGKLNQATMHQPLPVFEEIYSNREELSELLSLNENDLLDLPIQKVSCGVPYVIIPLKSLEAVESIQFRLDIWANIKDSLNAFVYCFTPDGLNESSSLHGRMFAPEAGILEDPATGSANGPLGCYVSKYNISHFPLVSEQGFELGRPSLIHIDIDHDERGNICDVKVGGQSVFVGQGEFFLQ